MSRARGANRSRGGCDEVDWSERLMLKSLSSFALRRSAAHVPVLNSSCGVEALESRPLLTVPAGFTETRVATGLAQPVQMEFAPDGRLFITEKTGNVRVMTAQGQ